MVVDGASAPDASTQQSCGYSEATYTTDSLNDLRSFSDAMAIVRAVKETIPPPSGPEGYAGLIGRTVTVRVERVLWRRPNAPEPPKRFRFHDLGWGGTLRKRQPLVVCGQTRMKLGRRYLAPIVGSHGTWYPFFPTRLRLRGDLVVGGVDGGEPENSHQALQGRRVKSAVRLVAEALPYRAVVLHPHMNPGNRWLRTDRDHYRLWHGRLGIPVIVTSGVTAKSRWQLYLRLPAGGGMCVGVAVRALWHEHRAASGEGCGARELRRRALSAASFMARHRGQFALGSAGSAVVSVRVTFDGQGAKEMATLPAPRPLSGEGRFWVAPADGACPAFTVQGLDRDGNVIAEKRLDYAACRSG